ncbi:MAG: hypothetical protein SOW50_01175 [Lachnospiraceae bacterium]|nr:hypothetical protein [Clostridiales bacterium]MDY3108710.1 hypothetical protein [Lachnospiraceae bacterium]
MERSSCRPVEPPCRQNEPPRPRCVMPRTEDCGCMTKCENKPGFLDERECEC